jgi:hypothetical protein
MRHGTPQDRSSSSDPAHGAHDFAKSLDTRLPELPVLRVHTQRLSTGTPAKLASDSQDREGSAACEALIKGLRRLAGEGNSGDGVSLVAVLAGLINDPRYHEPVMLWVSQNYPDVAPDIEAGVDALIGYGEVLRTRSDRRVGIHVDGALYC